MPETEVIAGGLVAAEPLEAKAEDTDALLVARAQAGELEAFNTLVLRHRERLYHVLYNITSNREDANDLTQECFLKAFKALPSFKGRSNFFTWLYRLSINTAFNHLKRQKRQRFLSLEQFDTEGCDASLKSLLTSKTSTQRQTFLNELQEKLNIALQKLSIKHRTAVVLTQIEGLSSEEAAEILAISPGTLRSRLHYAKGQLQKELKSWIQ